MKIGNRPELYRKTVNILFDAYFNDTLEHGNPCGCAIGNIVASNLGFQFKMSGDGRMIWKNGHPNWYYKIGDADRQISSTGYSPKEVSLIEKRFEGVSRAPRKDERMFNGLVAVLDVLKQIHEVTEDEETLPRFKAHYATLTTN